MQGEIAYSVIRRTLSDPGYNAALSADPETVLKQSGITDPALGSEVIQILRLVGAGISATNQETALLRKWMANQLKSTGETGDAFKEGLRNTLEQIDSGFRSISIMYQVAFYLGVVLVLASGFMAAFKQEPLLPIIFAGLGISDILAFFITKPPQQLQRSRSDLAQLQAAYYTWFIDIYNWNSLLIQLQQSPDVKNTFEIVRQVSGAMNENTLKTLAMIEKYCDFDDKSAAHSKSAAAAG